ncbi:MAG: hypothetical protein KBG28_19660 [Kofleriaceae bacterium]|nr:hypothetical protein [Kofleriaceae bacterium]
MKWRATAVLLVLGCGRHEFAPRVEPDAAGPIGADPVVQLSGGGSHSCARTAAGEVWCWGDGRFDPLGPPRATARGPTRVALPGPALEVIAGEDTTCVVTGAARDLLCWGHLPATAAGDPAPRRIELPGPVTTAAAGEAHWCALLVDGSVWCWGENRCGAVGDGTTTPRAQPTQVLAPDTGATALSVADVRTCALVAGQPVCWGAPLEDGVGTCAQPSLTPTPAPLPDERVAVQLTGGCHMHTCARAADGTVWCQGSNDSGQLGDGTTVAQVDWNQVPPFGPGRPAVEVQAGGFHTCVRAGAEVWCWGRNDHGEVGQAEVGTDVRTPQLVPALATVAVSQLAAGCGQTCVLTAGHVDCFGENDRMQLGDLTTDPSVTPVRVRVGLDR